METAKLENKKSGRGKKWLGITAGVLILVLAVFIYVKFYFVWGEGSKNGQLNYVVYKGYIFKTYEGKLIQAGLRSGNLGGSIQSNEFEFSVVDKKIADELMRSGGYEVDLYYKEYLGVLPWRGHSKYVVDSIISIKLRKEYPDNY